MKRTLSILLLILILTSAMAIPSGASSWVSVYIDGEKYSGITQVNQNTTYVGIRAFSKEMYPNAKITYSSSTRTLTVKTDRLTMICKDGANYIEANGRYLYTETPIYMSGGRMYAPVILLARALGAKISWSDSLRGFTVSRGTGGIEGRSYREDEVLWLSRIIYAESGGEPLKGKIAVGNVILNRVRSSAYPNTIYGVIFDKRYGIQFSPVSNGTIYNTPNAESIIAAKLCLDGYSISDDIIYFVNPKKAPGSWVSKNRPYFGTIGNHAFYE
ncbi:MAG: cell wall hydrolase [Clostridia bacterium]|nr:cell wall hydrolase [Clostridia bacterium]